VAPLRGLSEVNPRRRPRPEGRSGEPIHPEDAIAPRGVGSAAADTIPGEPQAEVGDRAARGVLWLTLQKWAIRVAGLLTIAVLTRVLSPEDFGAVAAASAILPFFYLLSDLGFATYIVQLPQAGRRTLATAFWFSIAAGIALALLLFLCAPLVAKLFGTETVSPVLQALSVLVILTAISSVPLALLRRQMRFRALAVQGMVGSLVGQIVAIACALSGLGVWALVAQTIAAQLVATVLACLAARWMPSWAFSRRELGHMITFGGKVLGVEVVAMARTSGEAAVVTSVLGVTSFGYLTISQRLVQIVQELTGAALTPVTTVAFARIREARSRLVFAYTRALRMTYAVVTPPLLLVAVAASVIIPIVFGPGWEESVVPAQLLALAGSIVIGATLDHGLFYGLGRPGTWLMYAVVVDIFTFATTVFVVRGGLVAVACGFLVVATLASLARLLLVARVLGVSPLRLARPGSYLVTTIIVSGSSGWLVMSLTTPWWPLVRIVLVGLTVLVVHMGVTWLLARPVYGDLVGYGRRLLGRGRPSTPAGGEAPPRESGERA